MSQRRAAGPPPIRFGGRSRALLAAAASTILLAGCAHAPPSGPLIGGEPPARVQTHGSVSLGQLATWGYPTEVSNPSGSPITLLSARVLPDGDSSGAPPRASLTRLLPYGPAAGDHSTPGLVVGAPKATWYGRATRPVAGYVLPPHTDADGTLLFVVVGAKPGRWRYRGFEVIYQTGGTRYTKDFTDNTLLMCVSAAGQEAGTCL